VRSSSPLRYPLHLAESKGDQHRLGVDIPIVGSDATAAIRDYLERRGPSDPSSPLFAFTNGTPLTHTYLVKCTAELAALAKIERVDPSTGRPYAGVSLREGGATWLSESGVEDRLVQKIGRWKSYCYARYIHSSDQTLDNTFATGTSCVGSRHVPAVLTVWGLLGVILTVSHAITPYTRLNTEVQGLIDG
jgi:hypothetical protein